VLLMNDVERVKQALRPIGFKFFSSPMFFANSQIEVHKLTKIEPGGKDYLFLDLLIIRSPVVDKIWESRQRLEWETQPVWVINKEWLIWMKLLRNSAQDLADIEKLRSTQ